MKRIYNITAMKLCLVIFGVVFLGLRLNGQTSIDSILVLIEENNTTLKALRENVLSQKLENRTGIFLESPEIGFNYLWGNPSAIGKRKDFSIVQTLDIPTITGMKSRAAGEKNQLIEWQYKGERMNILLEAKQHCIDLIYYNALSKELSMRLEHAETLANAYKERLDKGDANILEYNKAKLNLSTVKGEMSRVDIERGALIAQLKRLNGGIALSIEADRFPEVELPLSFDDWYAEAEQKSPVLAYIRQEIEVGKRQVSLNKAMSLPVFSAGYMSEKVVGERFQGISIGVSIPLWENKNRVKQANAAVRAAQFREIDGKRQFFEQIHIAYRRASGLKATAEMFRQSLDSANNSELLKKALDAGEISLLDYIVEMGLYYDSVNQTLEAERDYMKAYAELSAVDL